MCLLIRIISNGRNNVNEKGNNSFLNGRLTQVENRVEPHKRGDVYVFPNIDGASYIAPADGYIFVYGGAQVNFLDGYARISAPSETDDSNLFIRKGMALRRIGTKGLIRFISLA